MRKIWLFPLMLFFSGLICFAQSPELARIRASLKHMGDSLRYTDALNRMAMLLYEKNVDSTFYYARQAREIAGRLNYAKGKADAVDNLGIVFDIKGNLQLALRYYNEAYAAYSGLHDTANRVQAMMNIAMVYNELGKDQRSIQRFGEALNIGKKLGRDSIMALAIYDFLLEYPGHFSADSMAYYIGKATSIATKYKDERTLLAIGQLVADGMIAHDKREQGLALLEQTINGAISKKLYYVSMDMLIDMGDQLAATDPAKATSYYRQGLTVADKNGYLIYSQLLAKKLFDFYTARRDSLSAASYARRLVSLYDEQEKLANSSGIDYIDYALKDQQVKSLEQRSKYQTASLILAIIVCLLAVAVIIVIRHNLKRTKLLNERVIQQNSQMKKTLGALEQSQADNTRMMKIAAHDLRNPVGGIYSISDIMLREADRSENDRVMLELIKTSAQNSLELVSDLLQVQFNTEELKKEPVEIGEMLQYCVSLLQSKAEAKGQQISLQTQEFTVAANREKLWRVISNLISNAVKFSPSGAAIAVMMERDARAVLISVKDHGIGIPAKLGDKIFDMFTEAKRPGTAGEQPFGLGLAISKQIVEAHGGKIWFENTRGGGATFFVSLPAEPA
ncbi:MAG TPA: tetratricopeptide repeat-containing sensor histidine kinase [Mucilaginibacter sp.]|jgi:signal transduction histidine kinase|nr:tetratricopeptide repeat-containing sensor histidine kinase [Mucilaginibacter sp.]